MKKNKRKSRQPRNSKPTRPKTQKLEQKQPVSVMSICPRHELMVVTEFDTQAEANAYLAEVSAGGNDYLPCCENKVSHAGEA